MSDLEGILARACDHPGDVGTRLVLADWCEEHGDADRAEFIRLQLRLEELPEYDPSRFDIEERALDLLADHRDEWLSRVPAWARRELVPFRLGLPGEVKLPPGRFLTHGERLGRAMPLVRLTLLGLPEAAAQLAVSPALARVPELELAGVSLASKRLRDFLRRFPGDRVRHLGFEGNRTPLTRDSVLSGWAGLANLTSLSLRGLSPGDVNMAALLASLNFGRLERLELRDEILVGPRTALAVARNRSLAGLRVLGMADIRADEVGVTALAEGEWDGLESFSLTTGEAGPEAVARLASAPYFAGLHALDLCTFHAEEALGGLDPGRLTHLCLRRGVTSAALAALCASDLAEGLTSFRLSSQFSPDDLAPLTRWNRFARLRRLVVGSTPRASDLACRLIESPHFASLRELHLGQCVLTADAAARLPTLPGLARLGALSLWGVSGIKSTLSGLALSPHLSGLRRLDLGWNSLGDSGLQALLRADWLKNLRELRLCFASLSPAGVQALAACPALARLRLLELDDHAVGAAGAAALAASPSLNGLLRLRIASRRPARAVVEVLRDRFGGALELF